MINGTWHSIAIALLSTPRSRVNDNNGFSLLSFDLVKTFFVQLAMAQRDGALLVKQFLVE